MTQSLTRVAVYAAASIELYSRLWWELEQLIQSFEHRNESSLPQSDSGLVLLRLETIVLIDACDSTQLRSLLSAAQRDDLRSTLQSLLAALDDGELMDAQNRLLDTVLARIADAGGHSYVPPAPPLRTRLASGLQQRVQRPAVFLG